MAKTVLLSAPYLIPYMERFQPVYEHYGLDIIQAEVLNGFRREIMAYAGQFDGAVCGDDRFTERVLKACMPRLKVISKWGTGIDSIDRAAAERLGVKVCNTPNAFTLPVSDTVMGYILAFARQLQWMDRAMKSGVWAKLPGRSLSECTLGVIGVGNVGKGVLRRARGFGMTLLGNDIIPIAPDFILENGIQMVTLRLLDTRLYQCKCDLSRPAIS
jgi:D-3-phosphoglycerate dehydrogenase